VAVTPSSSATAVVAWGSNRSKQVKDHISKSIARHLTRFELVLLHRYVLSLETLLDQC
jgi:hypothetical protein